MQEGNGKDRDRFHFRIGLVCVYTDGIITKLSPFLGSAKHMVHILLFKCQQKIVLPVGLPHSQGHSLMSQSGQHILFSFR
jgi:hypothetical protein